MKQYLDLLSDIMENGEICENRTGINTKMVTGRMFSHDMRTGFPLLTTKKMNPNSIFVELEGFIKGITSKSWYQARKCYIWDEWCNPQEVKKYFTGELSHTIEKIVYNIINFPSKSHKVIPVMDSLLNEIGAIRNDWHVTFSDIDLSNFKQNINNLIQLYEDDLGEIYGKQWRQFGKSSGLIKINDTEYVVDGFEGIDQLKNLVNTMKKNPFDRRMIVLAWNPVDINNNTMALPPCHWAFEVHSNGKDFDLIWHQRSIDTLLGLPFNIASYAMMMKLLEKETGLKARYLKGFLGNVHVYDNHYEQIKLQLTREPRSLPNINIIDDMWSGIFNWTYDKYTVEGYDPHPFIKAPVAV